MPHCYSPRVYEDLVSLDVVSLDEIEILASQTTVHTCEHERLLHFFVNENVSIVDFRGGGALVVFINRHKPP